MTITVEEPMMKNGHESNPKDCVISSVEAARVRQSTANCSTHSHNNNNKNRINHWFILFRFQTGKKPSCPNRQRLIIWFDSQATSSCLNPANDLSLSVSFPSPVFLRPYFCSSIRTHGASAKREREKSWLVNDRGQGNDLTRDRVCARARRHHFRIGKGQTSRPFAKSNPSYF